MFNLNFSNFLNTFLLKMEDFIDRENEQYDEEINSDEYQNDKKSKSKERWANNIL